MTSEADALHASSAGHGAHGHGSLRSYMVGFGLSVALTAVPFWLVMSGALHDNRLTGFAIMAFAGVQMIVHVIYFLHVNAKSEQGWTLLALIFTLILVGIALIGSLWVMYHLNADMMPGMMQGSRGMGQMQ